MNLCGICYVLEWYIVAPPQIGVGYNTQYPVSAVSIVIAAPQIGLGYSPHNVRL